MTRRRLCPTRNPNDSLTVKLGGTMPSAVAHVPGWPADQSPQVFWLPLCQAPMQHAFLATPVAGSVGGPLLARAYCYNSGTELMPTSRKIDREHAAVELDELLESLTIPQLLDMAAALGKSSRIGHSKQKEHLVADLKTIVDFDSLCLAAHRIEALSPFKHAFLFSFDGPITVPDHAFKASRTRAADFTDSFDPVDLKNDTLVVQTAVPDEFALRLTVKLVHVVTSAEWAQTSPTERRLKKTRERHPIAVTLRFDSGLASIAFPGFTQGGATPPDQRISYNHIAKNAVALIKETLEIELTGLPVRPRLEALLNEPDAEVIDRGRAVRESKGGSIVVNCHGTTDDTGALLSKLLNQQIDPADVRSALRNATADIVWLYWRHLKIDTKLSLDEFAPALLFLWRRGGASAAHLEYVLQQLAPRRDEGRERVRQAEAHLRTVPSGDVLRVSDLMQRFGLKRDEALGILTPMLAANQFALRFRVNTNKRLLDYENTWTSALARLPISVTDEDEQEISLVDAGNIEVGYERIG